MLFSYQLPWAGSTSCYTSDYLAELQEALIAIFAGEELPHLVLGLFGRLIPLLGPIRNPAGALEPVQLDGAGRLSLTVAPMGPYVVLKLSEVAEVVPEGVVLLLELERTVVVLSHLLDELLLVGCPLLGGQEA